jgi:histidyl-tRNA synthetase
MKQKTQTLKGFRDFLPEENRKRQYVEKIIRETFESFAFEGITTPTLEYASLLLGKYGDEADKLLYTFEDRGGRLVGLRYDQTVPTARLLSQYQNQLGKYFRRYQIQNVFRADKPQKGRYREFTQCDCDIFGSNSPLADAEILAVYYQVFKNLGLTDIKIEYNDRQLLIGTLEEFATAAVDVFSIIQSIDKLDKLAPEAVVAELVEKGLTEAVAKKVLSKINSVEKSDNLKEIEQKAISLGVDPEALVFNPKIARGLDYYTGLIFEGKIEKYAVGSVGGGGRYDNLIEELSGLKMPAIGFGLGFDRIVEACDQLGLIPEENMGTQVLVSIFDDQKSEAKALEIASKLRQAKIKTEVFPANDKLGKQFKLANQKNIPWVVIIGDQEIEKDLISVKNMIRGEQEQLKLTDFIAKFNK